MASGTSERGGHWVVHCCTVNSDDTTTVNALPSPRTASRARHSTAVARIISKHLGHSKTACLRLERLDPAETSPRLHSDAAIGFQARHGRKFVRGSPGAVKSGGSGFVHLFRRHSGRMAGTGCAAVGWRARGVCTREKKVLCVYAAAYRGTHRSPSRGCWTNFLFCRLCHAHWTYYISSSRKQTKRSGLLLDTLSAIIIHAHIHPVSTFSSNTPPLSDGMLKAVSQDQDQTFFIALRSNRGVGGGEAHGQLLF